MNKRQRKKNHKKTDETTAIEILEAELIDSEAEFYRVTVEPMLEVAVQEVLRGTNAKELQQALSMAGFDMGRDKVYRLIKAAKAEIRKRSEKDFDDAYAWAQQNLFDMHRTAVKTGDDRMRLLVIKELIELFGLKRDDKTPREVEITPEIMEQFERALLR